jgi:outer membrane beta-barrel protein
MYKIVGILFALLVVGPTQAQEKSELDQILNESEPVEQDTVAEPDSAAAPAETATAVATPSPLPQRDVKVEPGSVSNLANLAPFEDVVVIQRKFLPRSGRFELSPSLGMIINNAFFTNFSLAGKIGYGFTEQYGIEGSVIHLGSNEKQVTSDLRTKRDVVTRTLVNPQLYYGLDFKWSPFYGKFGRMNKGIVPFDLFFVAGGGMTQTNQEESPFTFHVGTGQIFAWTQGIALRWDLGWYFYNLKGGSGRASGNFTDINLSIGASFFFPEVTYR